MRLRIILLSFLILVLAACTVAGEEPGSDPGTEVVVTSQPTATEEATAEPTEAATPTTVAEDCTDLPEVTTEGEDGVTVPENAVAVFQKTGGFAGIEETTFIYADGHIENNKNESAQVPPEVVDTLVSTAVDAGFFDLDRSYVPENYCCDFFNYSLTIRDCDQVHTVITADEVPGTPTELWQIIDTVQSLIANTSAAVPVPGTS